MRQKEHKRDINNKQVKHKQPAIETYITSKGDIAKAKYTKVTLILDTHKNKQGGHNKQTQATETYTTPSKGDIKNRMWRQKEQAK